MSDTFRKDYKVLSNDAQHLIRECKLQAEVLESIFVKIENREMAWAMGKLEETIMWASKAIVLNDEESNHDK